MIETDCPECHATSSSAAHHYLLWMCTSREGRNFYTFTCRVCQTPVAKPTVPIIEKLLSGRGVRRMFFALPLEMDDPQRADRRPLCEDDHLDLLNALNVWGVHVA